LRSLVNLCIRRQICLIPGGLILKVLQNWGI
jgi:hypothetical protein